MEYPDNALEDEKMGNGFYQPPTAVANAIAKSNAHPPLAASQNLWQNRFSHQNGLDAGIQNLDSEFNL